jgi:hypothetical protein
VQWLASDVSEGPAAVISKLENKTQNFSKTLIIPINVSRIKSHSVVSQNITKLHGVVSQNITKLHGVGVFLNETFEPKKHEIIRDLGGYLMGTFVLDFPTNIIRLV